MLYVWYEDSKLTTDEICAIFLKSLGYKDPKDNVPGSMLIHKYKDKYNFTNQIFVEVAHRPNTCYIFEKEIQNSLKTRLVLYF